MSKIPVVNVVRNMLLFLCFENVFVLNSLQVVSGERTVFTKPTSFSNYYANVNKNSQIDPYFDHGQFQPPPTPVSIPENIVNEYLLAPRPTYKMASMKNARKEMSENEVEHSSSGWGWPAKTKEKEVDTTLDELTGVMGPAFFLIPFVVKLIPFAIPAIPLSHILNNYAPASYSELITRLQEIATQLTEFFQQAAGTGAEAEG